MDRDILKMQGYRYSKDIEIQMDFSILKIYVDRKRYFKYVDIQVDRDVLKIQRYKWIEMF